MGEAPEEKARRMGVPVIPKRRTPVPVGPNPTIAVCGACGIDLKGVMHFVCNHDDCPCFNRPRG